MVKKSERPFPASRSNNAGKDQSHFVQKLEEREPASDENVKHGKIYVIQDGDTLWKLAQQWGVSVKALKKANHGHSHSLRPGATLVIPR